MSEASVADDNLKTRILNLKLHETVSVSKHTLVMGVIGGWIYIIENFDPASGGPMSLTSTFVPYPKDDNI